MKPFFTVLTLLGYLFFSTLTLSAQGVYKINSINSQSKQSTAHTITGAEQQRQYFTLHDEAAAFSAISSGDLIDVEVAQGLVSSFRVHRVESYTSNTTSFITSDIENPENTFTFTYSDGMLHGLYHKSHDDVYFFEYDKGASQNYISKSSTYYDDEEFCSIHEVDHGLIDFNDIPFKAKSTSSASEAVQSYVPSTAAMASSLDDETIIDVMIPYTENARIWAESTSFNSIDNVIATSIALSQSALDNSNTNITLRLVHYYQTNYAGDSLDKLSESDPDYVSAGDHLRRLTRDEDNPSNLCSDDECQEADYDGFFNDVHILRNQYGADVVASVLSEPNTGGIAWVNMSTAGSSMMGFSINRVQQIATNYTLIHEIGHNMGNAHARNQLTSPADEFGGLFAYSAGNRFTTSENSYATIMAYTEGGYTYIPYFSSPDITYSGTTTGNPITFTSDGGPSDNARSMREIKSVIASYRTSIVDAPVVDVDVTSITATLDQGNSTEVVPVTIQNSGNSKLMWDLDFDISSGTVTKRKSATIAETIKPADISLVDGYSSNISFTANDDPGIIFSTGFESSEGFSSGNFPARVGWRSFSSTAPFEISAENPSEGVHHLRLPRRSEFSSAVFVRSPFFGPQAMGEFSISFDIAIQDQLVNGSGETFYMYIYDGSNASLSSAIIISSGNIFALNVDEQGNEGFSFTGNTFPTNGTFGNFEIRFMPDERSVDYYLNGIMIGSNPYPAGRKPDYIHFGQRNKVNGSHMDVDNIRVERIHSPFSWLNIEDFAGIIGPGESETINLTLTAEDVATGSYQTVLNVRSNDPANPIIEVPISVSVDMATSSEVTPELPLTTELSQNYPNPFNPSTSIEFSLNQAADVTLEVFNITGQRVATLVQGRLSAGSHARSFDASALASGLYLYRLKTAETNLTRQMILLK